APPWRQALARPAVRRRPPQGPAAPPSLGRARCGWRARRRRPGRPRKRGGWRCRGDRGRARRERRSGDGRSQRYPGHRTHGAEASCPGGCHAPAARLIHRPIRAAGAAGRRPCHSGGTAMNVTADTVRALRERTGAGMMECKRALVETGGDLDAAAELMRKQGLAKADKKAARVAAEGVIVIERAADGRAAAMAEINCETDFVAREQDFRRFAADVVRLAITERPIDVEALLACELAAGESVDQRRRALVAKIGENISVRRYVVLQSSGLLGAYLHGTRIGVLVELDGGTAELAHDLAMHI